MVISLKTQISTSLFSQTKSFYQTIFGMVVIEEWGSLEGDKPKDTGVILGFPLGKKETLLEIYLSQTPYDFDGVSLQFKVDSMADFIAGLPSGVDREGPVIRPWGATYLYLKDPNQIQVIVYQEGD